MAGSPAGPGAGAPVSPGGGAGNNAAARGILTSIIPALHRALMAFPVNSPEYKAVDKMLAAATPVFGKANDQNLVPAAVAQLGNAARGAVSPISTGAPPLAPAPPPGAGPSPGPSPDMAA